MRADSRSAALHLAPQVGYFKAKAPLFVYAREAVPDDIRHLLARHFPSRERDTKPPPAAGLASEGGGKFNESIVGIVL